MIPATKPAYIWHNGTIEKTGEANFDRILSSLSTITFSETIITRGTEIMFFDETLKRLKYLAKIYCINPSLIAGINGENLKSEIKRALIRNKCYQTARCFIVFQKAASIHQTNEFIFIEPDPILFSPNKTVSNIFIATGFSKPDGFATRLPSLEQEYRKLLKLEMDANNADDCLIINQHQNIIETFLGNIFMVSNNKVITPGLATGCTPHLTRQFVIDRLNLLGYLVAEKDSISRQDIYNCTEMFTAGTNGIFFIKGIENKRYFDKIRKELLKSVEENF